MTAPSNIVASSGQGKVELMIETKTHEDVLHLMSNICHQCNHHHPHYHRHHLLPHHHQHPYHHDHEVLYRATGALVRLQKSNPRLFFTSAHLLKIIVDDNDESEHDGNDENEIKKIKEKV